MRKFVNTWILSGSVPLSMPEPVLYESADEAFKRNASRHETIEVEVSEGIEAHKLGGLSANELREQFPLRPVLGGSGGTCASTPTSPGNTADIVTVGDLNSTARGSGARKSAGKPDWSQFPWWVMRPIFDAWKAHDVRNMSAGTLRVIELMAEWQRGKDSSLDLAAALLLEIIYAPAGRPLNDKTSGDWFPARGFESTVRVLEFGAIKYKKGNWARGMPWTVVFNSCLSHLTKMFQGEENDHESGLPHSAHAMCNIVFLLGYRDLFPEGDDRQPEFRPGGTTPVEVLIND